MSVIHRRSLTTVRVLYIAITRSGMERETDRNDSADVFLEIVQLWVK